MMDAEEVSEEEFRAAKEELEHAIKAYYKRVYPDVYIDGWILITNKLSPQAEQHNTSIIGLLEEDELSWPTALGMLQITLDTKRGMIRSWDNQ